MRLADADLLPFQFTNFADTIKKYLDELQKTLKDQRSEAEERTKNLQDGVYDAVSDPKNPMGPPKVLEPTPYLNFAPLENALAALTKSAQRYQDAVSKLRSAHDLQLPDQTEKEINADLMRTERTLTTAQGLTDRPWFKHAIYAPGAYTGYGVKTLPAIREPLEVRHYAQAEAGIPVVAGVLQNEANLINSIAEKIEAATGGATPQQGQ
jgi:N-acetylated-alpha-linked acidic dipeptidase